MSGFKALNIESDSESDIEIDDTKELQIEDALKLYQTALKHHAAGPDSYELAAEAYEELFRSEIFQYPESQIELRRIELYGSVTEVDDLWQDDFSPEAVIGSSGAETGPSTLPQILHLSHKNYAQFRLEYLTARLEMLHVNLNQILSDATIALDHFVEALDKDDSDLNLWRCTSGVGEMLDSKRVARFCLEAVLDNDDEALDSALSLPGLDEGLAVEQLRHLVGQLEDELSVLQSPLLRSKRKLISKILKKRLGSYNRIMEAKRALKPEQTDRPRQPVKVVLKAPDTWAEVGELLLRQLMAEQHGTSPVHPAIAIDFGTNGVDERMLDAAPSPSPRLQIEAPSIVAEVVIFSNAIADQFPGLDEGKPTTQPRIASADIGMDEVTRASSTTEVTMIDGPAISLPTRKRSGDTAGINDGTEEGRTKSKRTRVRESTTAEDSRQAINAQWEFEQQLSEIQAADDWMFDTVGNLFERVGIVGFDAARNVREELQSPRVDVALTNGTQDSEGINGTKSDLHSFLLGYTDHLANNFLVGGDSLDFGKASKVPGANGSASTNATSRGARKLKPMPNDELHHFLSEVHNGWYMTHEVAYNWINIMLRPGSAAGSSPYVQYEWPEALKTMVVRNLVNFDSEFMQEATAELDAWQRSTNFHPSDNGLVEMLQSMFELHLDIYCLIKEPKSGVDAITVSEQRDRLQRWSHLAREAMHFKGIATESPALNDSLDVRFMWATTFYLGSALDVSQDHVIECMNDLRAVLSSLDDVHIQLQNNAIMPEISLGALDREVSELTTRDFFLKVMSQDGTDPVSTIENLEPLLMALRCSSRDHTEEDDDDDAQQEAIASSDLGKFLQGSAVSVRMHLWQNLRDAYLAIEYKPMVVSCHFNMIRLLLAELRSKDTTAKPQYDRQVYALKVLRMVRGLIARTWTIIHKSTEAFECVDERLLKDAVSGLGEVLQLLQVFNVLFDSIRIGQSQPPSLPNGSATATFDTFRSRTQDMQVETWCILYALLKEAIFQFHDRFPNPAEDMFDFLRAVHRNLGLRGICGNLNKVFIRTVRDEFVQMTHIEGYDSEQAQVLYDLYGLNCFLNPSYELIEHHCQHDAFIEKSVALQAVDLLLQQASKLPTKDLIKHPIKDTIEKVHGAAPRKKPTEPILRNREIYRAFLRSPINPLDLFSCLKGEGSYLTTSHVPREDAALASKGWYFLMGHLALAKFRSVKRTTQSQTEDVDIAIAFFMQDLEFSMDKWETWFRLAQAYDTKIEESIVWSAEKLNNSMPEIVQLQRAAIHCYTMATALAYRSADLVEETSEKMTDLFVEFGLRLYASSREPFSMQPFSLDDQEKFLSLSTGVSKGKLFQPLRPYTAWKLAKVLLQRGIKSQTQPWMTHFALGKCLWKMHTASDYIKKSRTIPPTAEEVLASLIKAIELIPDERKKDSREKREPVLEPHYRLVSIVHKLLIRGSITLAEAREALSNTPYARTPSFPQEMDEWVPHILTILKTLRAADKSNWHHRMIARSAQIIYDDSDPRADASVGSRNLGAMGAKHELTQQMFTKTMVLQVWRPDSERAGRHFVYTARYTRFFLKILEQLNDRSNLEQLAKRVRKRVHDLFEHGAVWQDICTAYLRLLRSHAALEEGLETSTFSNILHEDFLARKEPLEKWMQGQEKGASTALDVLREVQDLKKLNQSLMKPGPIDDLIGDAYAFLFNTIGKALWEDQQRIKREMEAHSAPPEAPKYPVMNVLNLMNFGADGADDRNSMPGSAPALSAATAPDSAPARRKTGVGRREIRTCAEACFQKTQTSSTAVSGTASRQLPLTYPRVQVVIDNSGMAHAGDASVDTSAPGSIHDSADDESELSELEEEEEEEEGDGVAVGVKEEDRPRVMFPGLATGAVESREGTEGFVTAAEEEEEEEGVGGARPHVEIGEADRRSDVGSANGG